MIWEYGNSEKFTTEELVDKFEIILSRGEVNYRGELTAERLIKWDDDDIWILQGKFFILIYFCIYEFYFRII